MEHRGIEYKVVEIAGIRGSIDLWNWSVKIGLYTTASGTEISHPAAIAAAERKIDQALEPKMPEARAR